MEDLERLLNALDPNTDPDSYTRGVRDVLRLLGLLDGEGAPRTDVAAMLLAVLRAHAADGVPLSVDWDDLDADGLRGVDVIRWMEAARVHQVEDPTPARRAEAVGVIIKRGRGADAAYLLQYDRHAGRYQPIGGKIDPEDATPEAALRREIFEELELPAVPGPDLIAVRPVGTHHTERELSATYGLLTHYGFRYYFAERVAFRVVESDITRWISRVHLQSGTAPDGRPVSPIYGAALGLRLLDALPPTRIERD